MVLTKQKRCLKQMQNVIMGEGCIYSHPFTSTAGGILMLPQICRRLSLKVEKESVGSWRCDVLSEQNQRQ